MSQFDVHRNRGQSRDGVPFVVVVQSSLYDEYARRIVVPLVRKSYLGTISQPALNPAFNIKNVTVVLHPLEMVSVPVEKLGERVGSLASDSDKIIGALDELLSRAWD